ncbi:MAG: hypothetical protein ABJC09_08925 [Terriglobia bacterium]
MSTAMASYHGMRLLTRLPGALIIATSVAAQSVSLHIEPAAVQSQFRIGEEIALKAVFEVIPGSDAPSADQPGWTIMLNGPDRSVLGFGHDRFAVTPEAGTRDPWSYRLHEGIIYSGPGGSRLGDKPLILNMDLNQWVRFERPGRYTVHALSHATGPRRQNVEVESNQIAIDIVAADPLWQEQELARDVAILNSTVSKLDSASFESRMSAARRLTYLDTPAAVVEMAHWLGAADIQTAQVLQDGLRSSQHGPAAVTALKEFLRTPSEPVTPIFLRTLAALDKTFTEPQHALAAVVEQKQGADKAISIKTLLDSMSAGSVTARLRSEIAALFTQLPPSQQSELLGYQWEKIDTPEMIPVLRQIYETAAQSRYPENPLFASAVERLYALDTNRTRLLLLEEMKRPEPRLPYSTLAMLPDTTLPELDATLLDHLQHDGGRPAEELIARYSTKSILDSVKEYYAKRDAEMRSRVTTNPNIAAPACEPPLVAYFLRVDSAWGEKVLRQSLAERNYTMGRCWVGIIGQTAVYDSGPVWEKVAIDALEDNAVPVKIDAIKSLARYGSPAARPAIFATFRYWHRWWENRGDQNDESRRLEQALVEATTRARNWTPDDADLATIRDLCLSASCKSQVPQRQNQ